MQHGWRLVENIDSDEIILWRVLAAYGIMTAPSIQLWVLEAGGKVGTTLLFSQKAWQALVAGVSKALE